jgi:hypothetical protein
MTAAPLPGAADDSSTHGSGLVAVEAASRPLKAAVAFFTANNRRPVMPAHEVVNDCGQVGRWPSRRSANA